ncbi:two component transcriptional regulator, LytTR family [Hathewaya proteolytica DSM 3090]|uniref:Stage 0 sporulation protein A homolog n=1 Tax=Hathewaya proteolytica DSM 3090 TaxID=1121331 RepID=A0A1M6M330_9CLOT|nr:LytTR family DNA-binding domain-containing protein [Hathewaya proteolytica]SHJ77777.1 two component transcriptional regulator, LytTR family [Hathewaya proteolytica DSM 3090]
MLSVIICEDSSIQCSKIEKIVSDLIGQWEFDFQLKLSARTPDQVLEYIEENNVRRGIYILDIDLNNSVNGLQLASLIRERDALGYIIFLTTHSEMSFLTFKYKVEAIDYIIKDNFNNVRANLQKTLSYINDNFEKTEKKENVLLLEQEGRKIKIMLDEVMFIETSQSPHKLVVHEKNRIFEIYGTLREFEENLPENFYRSHRAYIVNKNNIIEVDKKRRILMMKNGEQCFVSFRCLTGLKK